MTRLLLPKALLLACCIGFTALMAVRASAEDSTSADDWQYGATIYLWAAGTEGQLTNGEDFDIDFDDVLQNLNMAFMGNIEARKSKWSVLLDGIYLDMRVSESASIQLPVIGDVELIGKVKGNVEVKAWFLNAFGGYSVWDTEQGTLDLIAGARYFDLDIDVTVDGGIARRAGSKDFSPSVNVLDGVVGARGHFNLDKNWYLPYHLDAGTGQSDFTWQVLAGAGYRFGWGNVVLTYRYMEWNFDSAAVDNFDLNGPLLGARFNF